MKFKKTVRGTYISADGRFCMGKIRRSNNDGGRAYGPNGGRNMGTVWIAYDASTQTKIDLGTMKECREWFKKALT